MFGTIRKLADEGTSTPFVARIYLGFLELRDYHLSFGNSQGDREDRRRELDREIEPFVASLAAVRDAARKIVTSVQAHNEKMKSGAIVSHQRNAVTISESIDSELTDELGKIYERGYAATQRLQAITRMLGLEIGFLFQKESNFLAGIEAARAAGRPELAAYLQAIRTTWLQAFMAARVAFTHSGTSSLSCEYKGAPGVAVEVVLPTIEGVPIDSYARVTASRLIRACEDLLAYAVASSIEKPVVLAEIPREARDPSIARRFVTGLEGQGVPGWILQYEAEDLL